VDSRADLQAALDNNTYRFISSRQRNSEIRELVNPIFQFIELFLGVASDAAGLVSLIHHQSITSKEFFAQSRQKSNASKIIFSAITVLFNVRALLSMYYI
jgi:hypothetical protein